MELEDLKSAWKKNNEKPYNQIGDYNLIMPKHKSWFISNRTAIEGMLSIVVATFLIVMLIIQQFNSPNRITIFIYLFWFIISIYTFAKGVWTVLFFIEKRKLDMASSKFILINLKNQLYFVYEKMTWLWLLLPLIMLVLPFIVLKFITIKHAIIVSYVVAAGILYLILLFVFSRLLWRKKHKLQTEIKQIQINS